MHAQLGEERQRRCEQQHAERNREAGTQSVGELARQRRDEHDETGERQLRFAGARSAAPAPCSTRAAIRNASEDARPHSSDAPVNTARPLAKKRRRPK
jgi:hypothetical protein